MSDREARQAQREAEREARIAAQRDAAFDPSLVGRRNQVAIPRIETVGERKAREDRERAAALLAGGVSIPQAKPAPVAIKVRRSTLDADGSVRLMSDEECKALDAALDRARTEHNQSTGGTSYKGPRAKSAGPRKSDKAPEIHSVHDDKGYILPTGFASQREVTDAELRFTILRDELRAEVQAGTLDVKAARKMLADAKKEDREVVRCRSRINGVCDGNKFCMRCGGSGWLIIAQREDAPSFVDTSEPETPLAYVRLIGADTGVHLDLTVTKGDPIEAAENYLVSDAAWVAAKITNANGTPLVIATYWTASGDVERDEKGKAMRTFHGTEADAAFAATVWCANNPGARVTTGLSRGEALMIHREKERQTRRVYSEAMKSYEAKYGPEAVHLDDPRKQSSRAAGCVINPADVRKARGPSMPISAELRKCMRPR